MNIIARKPRSKETEFIVVDRGTADMPFVVATADEHSLSHGEWFWGYYFPTREKALEFFNGREGEK